VDLNYEITGPADGPAVVLSNSIGTDLGLWDAQMPALSGYRVLRYDQRGHGRSPAPPGPYELGQLGGDVLRLLDAEGIDSAHFAGVSLGGMTGMWLGEHHPDRINRLALLCTSAAFGPPEAWQERAATVREQGTDAVAEASFQRWFTPEFAQRGDVADKYLPMIRNAADEGYAGCCEAISSMTIADQLERITAPTLVIAGADDPSTPPPHAERIAAGIPGAVVRVLDNAAHLANVERAEEVNRLLTAHFAGTPLN
jgi:3-oxoadipate enol-lactonase